MSEKQKSKPMKQKKNSNTKRAGVAVDAPVRRHRCQFLRDNGKPCGRLAMRHKERVFLDSSCSHGGGLVRSACLRGSCQGPIY